MQPTEGPDREHAALQRALAMMEDTVVTIADANPDRARVGVR